MKKEFNSNSRNSKNDLLYHYLSLVILYANKAQTLENDESSTNAAVRITTKFINLLENQFPVMSPDISISLKYPQDFADLLSIHVNHLNKSTKEVLQKTTSEIISDRLLQEARSLLQNTDWSISEISNSLGFEYPSHFNSFFKKHTKLTPSAIRNTLTKS
jgi:AraC family transcriptional regulator, transcriptional activator of pobA